jgi:tyrosyl-tRNA synthetase
MDYFELVTDVPDEELKGFRKDLEAQTVNPMMLKKRLAREIVTQLYDQKAAVEAEGHFAKVHQKRELPKEIPEYRVSFSKEAPPNFPYEFPIKFPVPGDIDLGRLIAAIGLAKSRSDANRLIRQGAVSIDGEKVTSPLAPIKSGSIIKVGKRRFAKVIDTDKLEHKGDK